MAFAAANNLKVAPRGGGHSYVGASTANGAMVLDLRQLPGGIDYDAATGQVTVTPATSLYAMHQALAAAGRGIPTGTCPSVGAAGHALGGGMGAAFPPCGPDVRRVAVGDGGAAQRPGGHRVRRQPTRICSGRCAAAVAATSG